IEVRRVAAATEPREAGTGPGLGEHRELGARNPAFEVEHLDEEPGAGRHVGGFGRQSDAAAPGEVLELRAGIVDRSEERYCLPGAAVDVERDGAGPRGHVAPRSEAPRGRRLVEPDEAGLPGVDPGVRIARLPRAQV